MDPPIPGATGPCHLTTRHWRTNPCGCQRHTHLEKKAVDSACSFTSEIWQEQRFRATGTFGANSDDLSVWARFFTRYSVKSRPAKWRMTPSPESIAMNVFQRSDRSRGHSPAHQDSPIVCSRSQAPESRVQELLANQPADSDTEPCKSVSGGVAQHLKTAQSGLPSRTRSTPHCASVPSSMISGMGMKFPWNMLWLHHPLGKERNIFGLLLDVFHLRSQLFQRRKMFNE